MNPMSETTHQRLPAEVGNLSGRAIAVSREIHQDPELAFRSTMPRASSRHGWASPRSVETSP